MLTLASGSADPLPAELTHLPDGTPLAESTGPLATWTRRLTDIVRQQAAEIERLRALAVTDPLTGLYNRRGFEDLLERALAASRRHGETGLLALIDLDRFKPINDRHGHAAGDAVLEAIARVIAGSIRATDCAARPGGDEFALLFVHCDPEGAAARLARLRNAIEALRLDWAGARLGVTASLGIAPYGPGSEARTLLAAADAALYADKTARKAASGLRSA
ncbi:MAG: GGDEF domain-containing protein [Alphaproteobacteria bacterium]|nr:GGDEF domain-containing protein [Alphaproteobacteria bacterium]